VLLSFTLSTLLVKSYKTGKGKDIYIIYHYILSFGISQFNAVISPRSVAISDVDTTLWERQ
jgi:hypothetical protein